MTGHWPVNCPECGRDLPIRVPKTVTGVYTGPGDLVILTAWCRRCDGPALLTADDLHLTPFPVRQGDVALPAVSERPGAHRPPTSLPGAPE